MRNIKGLMLAAAFSVVPAAAWAEGPVTLGSRLAAISEELWTPFVFLISCGSFIAGLFLLGIGLTKLAKQHETRGGLWESGLAHLFAAALLISLPDAAGVGLRTLYGTTAAGNSLGITGLDVGQDGGVPGGNPMSEMLGNLASVGQVDDCLVKDAPAACMGANIARNAIPMAVWTLFAFATLAGLFQFASAIMDLVKGQQQGGPPKGLAVKFITAILLINSIGLYTLASRTVLGNEDNPIGKGGLNASSNMLTYTVEPTFEVLKKYAELIGHAFTILAFFGAWAFVRGVFMLRSTAEGKGQGSFGMAMVYIVAGILLANAKYSSCVIMTTLGGDGMGNGFCPSS